MTTVDRSIVKNLAANSPSLDEIAALIFDAVAKVGVSGQTPEPGVQFSAVEGTTSFRARAHRVDLLVRYEQEVHLNDGIKVLRGVFRARLDEPMKADQKVISSFWFDSFGNTQSTGNVIKQIYRVEGRQQVIRDDVAYLLAYDVQRHIQADTPEV